MSSKFLIITLLSSIFCSFSTSSSQEEESGAWGISSSSLAGATNSHMQHSSETQSREWSNSNSRINSGQGSEFHSYGTRSFSTEGPIMNPHLLRTNLNPGVYHNEITIQNCPPGTSSKDFILSLPRNPNDDSNRETRTLVTRKEMVKCPECNHDFMFKNTQYVKRESSNSRRSGSSQLSYRITRSN